MGPSWANLSQDSLRASDEDNEVAGRRVAVSAAVIVANDSLVRARQAGDGRRKTSRSHFVPAFTLVDGRQRPLKDAAPEFGHTRTHERFNENRNKKLSICKTLSHYGFR